MDILNTYFILDVPYNQYYTYIAKIINLFKEKININNNLYEIRGIITMPSELHYACYILNNKENYLNLGPSKTLYHDGLQNNGFIIESELTIEEIIKNNVCYIFIISKID